MKITRLSTYAVPPRWLFLKIETDADIYGWGEPIVEGRAATIAAVVDELGDCLIGQDPMRIEDHWQAMYSRRVLSRWSGVDERDRRCRPGAAGHQGQTLRCASLATHGGRVQGPGPGLFLGWWRNRRCGGWSPYARPLVMASMA